MSEKNIPREVARSLLTIEAIKLSPADPFTWSSGWKSPIYCDNRLSLSYPEIRTFVKNALANEISHQFPSVEAIAGVATAGIPQGALVADALNKPFIYVRSKPKGHGMENLIEGKPVVGQKVVVIEDLISTGGSSLKAVHALREAHIEVVGLAAIFSYGFQQATDAFSEAGVPYFTLSNYATLLEEAVEMKYIDTDQLKSLQEWNHNPEEWSN